MLISQLLLGNLITNLSIWCSFYKVPKTVYHFLWELILDLAGAWLKLRYSPIHTFNEVTNLSLLPNKRFRAYKRHLDALLDHKLQKFDSPTIWDCLLEKSFHIYLLIRYTTYRDCCISSTYVAPQWSHVRTSTYRSFLFAIWLLVAQWLKRLTGYQNVAGSIPVWGSETFFWVCG